MPNPRWIKLIHVAKRETGLSDERYRDLLAGAANVASSREIAHRDQFQAVMLAFERLGFKRRPLAGGVASPKRPPRACVDRDYQQTLHAAGRVDDAQRHRARSAPWLCYTRQRRAIEALWRDRARNKTHAALSSFCRRVTGSDPEFMAPTQATRVIVALKKL